METENPLHSASRSTSPASGGGKRAEHARALSSSVHGGGGSPRSGEPEGAAHVVCLARTWIGTPYVHQASVKGAGCDCLGLLRGIWRELRGPEPEDVPPYAPDWDARGREMLREACARHLAAVPLTEIAPGDVVLFRMVPRAPARHCAVVGERDGALTLIHSRQNKRVSEEPFTAFWRSRLAYALRM